MKEDAALGEGTNGIVRRGTRKSTGVVRAIKAVQKRHMQDVRAFKQEIQVMKMMDHPNIIKLYEIFENSNKMYLVMELCTGGELFDRILKAGQFTEHEAAVVMQQIFRAVCYLHDMNITHRDLKPENFLFLHEGPIEENVLKLIDFGLSCHLQPGEFHRQVVGTPQYVAPQVLSRKYDKRCDMWSCGVIMYTLLSGKAAFGGKNEQEVLNKVRNGYVSLAGPAWEHVSPEAKNLIRALLKRNPSNRLTADQALDHAWLAEAVPRQTDVQLEHGFLDRLREFKSHDNLKKAALHAIADQLTDEQTRHLREVFNALDTSRTGVLTFGDLRSSLERAGLAAPDLEQILRGVDISRSGAIDYTEFLAAALDRHSHLNDDVIWSAFNLFELDGDGRISQKELLKALSSSECSTASRGATLTSRSAPSTPSDDGDGRINFEEFVTLVRTESRTQE
uniref:non-specific serine/threonine protein kinase n=1 Tax=Zooxanthella nutricula TaxID=1333877 RepID=A0A7S2LES8_9DINO